jgi:hypothetical protein
VFHSFITLELMFPLYLIFHVKVYSLFPLTSKGVYKDLHLQNNSFNIKGVFFLIKLGNTPKKEGN